MAVRQRGDRGPAKRLPPEVSYRCRYVRMWVGVKHVSGLAADAAEKRGRGATGAAGVLGVSEGFRPPSRSLPGNAVMWAIGPP
ncbi:hypothetical protein B1H19_13820 [Streptomyces gilvosporeus]|uniref:Uncharacterized protein n=1 Tax=Streptomyces gilvosporeus TaxID=553510 RepID=A0A1V0TR39_9ACTN|nr:hypothetical protein B1H19_13820 [Streptomyces gilvosporeus]